MKFLTELKSTNNTDDRGKGVQTNLRKRNYSKNAIEEGQSYVEDKQVQRKAITFFH